METITSGSFLPRAAAAAIERAARIAPVVVLLGARQTGKTTLLRQLALQAVEAGVSLNRLASAKLSH
jgi:predicted AAA+ superfamily ATPase